LIYLAVYHLASSRLTIQPSILPEKSHSLPVVVAEASSPLGGVGGLGTPGIGASRSALRAVTRASKCAFYGRVGEIYFLQLFIEKAYLLFFLASGFISDLLFNVSIACLSRRRTRRPSSTSKIRKRVRPFQPPNTLPTPPSALPRPRASRRRRAARWAFPRKAQRWLVQILRSRRPTPRPTPRWIEGFREPGADPQKVI
jgi:hypothetical protein